MWKDIIGYEGRYQISDSGEVKSLAKTGLRSRNRLRSGCDKILKPFPNMKGYLLVDLISKTISVHRLVAIHFIKNTESKEQVNHKDGNKLNNNASNLEWVTNQENIKHSWDNGLRDEMNKKRSHKVAQIDKITGEIIKIWDSIKSTRRAGFLSVEKVVSDKYPHCKSCKGFFWKLI